MGASRRDMDAGWRLERCGRGEERREEKIEI